MATKIKLMRLGKMRAPYYRIVIADARNKRDGRVIETIGKYHPKENPSFIEVDPERAAYWLGVGAQPTDPVQRILKVTGDWQKFKGEAAPPPMLVAEPKPDRKAAFEAAALEGVQGAGKGDATTPSKKKAPKEAVANTVADGSPEAAAAATPGAPEVPAAEAAPEAPAANSDDDVKAAAAADSPQGAVEPEAAATTDAPSEA